jgi:threonyl-tRNA synthetase
MMPFIILQTEIISQKNMDQIKVYFKDGTAKNYPQGVLVKDLLGDDQGSGRSDEVIAAKINGTLRDLQAALEQGGELEWVGLSSVQGTEILRHSTSHIMAQAVQSLFPNARITIGPAIKNGFYYDFDCERSFSPEDFPRIEAKMQEIIKKDLPIVRQEVFREEALRLFRERGEIYKVELIEEIADSKVTLYRQGEFVDLCRGPHLASTGMIKAFKLTSVAGAYWHGDERNKMLQRIYATAFPSVATLEKHLLYLEEARRRDHRKIGRELDLFSINDEAGAGLVIYHPKGAILRMLLEDFEKREHLKRGYQLVIGPQILKLDLWKRSGHYDHYREKMYFTEVEGQAYGIKR